MPIAENRSQATASRIPPLRRRTQLSDDVADHIRRLIMTGQIKPGEFIRLDETAAQLGVSITPVREALLTLRGEGMVQLQRNRGYEVAPISRTDISDIFWLQSQLAVELAIRATERISPEALARLADITAEIASAVEKGDSDALAASIFEFHRTMNYESGGTKLAWFLQRALLYTPHHFFANDDEWARQALRNHEQLIAAMRAKDAGTVRELVRAQFIDGGERLIKYLDDIGMWDHGGS